MQTADGAKTLVSAQPRDVVAHVHRAGRAGAAGGRARVSGRLTIVRPGLPLPDAAARRDWSCRSTSSVDWIERRTRARAPVGRHAKAACSSIVSRASGRPLPLGLALRAMSRGRVLGRGRQRPAADADRGPAGALGRPGSRPSRFACRRCSETSARDGGRRRARPGAARDPSSLDLVAVAAVPANRPELRRAGRRFGRPHRRRRQRRSTRSPARRSCSRPTTCRRSSRASKCITSRRARRSGISRSCRRFVMNDAFDAAADAALGGRRPAFVYQRYSLNNFSGVRVARRHGVPLVLEYNGSEIWMSRHWGRPLEHEALSERIEQLNLAAADLIVVVSRAMRMSWSARGVDAAARAREPERRRPGSLSAGRRRLARFASATACDGTIVIGFIGTFGPWHGAEMLAARVRAGCSTSDPRLRAARPPADDRRRREDARRCGRFSRHGGAAASRC